MARGNDDDEEREERAEATLETSADGDGSETTPANGIFGVGHGAAAFIGRTNDDG